MSTPKEKRFWLIKFAPFRTSWVQVVKCGGFTMRGVRNVQARNYLATMRIGEQVFFYHSQQELAVVGLCEVESPAFQDPTSADSRWLAVTFRPIKTLASPVPLSLIRNTLGLEQIGVVRQPRLSVMPLTESQFRIVLALSE